MSSSYTRLRAPREDDDTLRLGLIAATTKAEEGVIDAGARVHQSSTRLADAAKQVRADARKRAIANAIAVSGGRR